MIGKLSPCFVAKHIGWSLKKLTHDQNQPKSLPTPTHGLKDNAAK